MDEVVTKLAKLPSCSWNLHETVLAQRLGIKAKEGCSIHTQVSALVSFLGQGGAGNKKNKTFTACTTGIVDLTQPNKLSVQVYVFGPKENFAAHSLQNSTSVTKIPRWFKFGHNAVTPKEQTQILKAVVGDVVGEDRNAMERRKKNVLGWYKKEGNAFKSYEGRGSPSHCVQFSNALPRR